MQENKEKRIRSKNRVMYNDVCSESDMSTTKTSYSPPKNNSQVVKLQQKVDLDNKIKEDRRRLVEGKRLRKKSNVIRKNNLNINYDDLNRKDNFIFFEIFAVYANEYVDDKDKNAESMEKVFRKRRTRRDRTKKA